LTEGAKRQKIRYTALWKHHKQSSCNICCIRRTNQVVISCTVKKSTDLISQIIPSKPSRHIVYGEKVHRFNQSNLTQHNSTEQTRSSYRVRWKSPPI